MRALLLLHFCATWALVGLIWTIQVVQYPLFAKVGQEQFAAYQAWHSALITLLVGPLMLLELGSGFLLLVSPQGTPTWGWGVGLVLIGIIWLTTAFVSVPLHARLAAGFDAQAHALLVGTNWIRTLAWSARGLLLAWVLYKTL